MNSSGVISSAVNFCSTDKIKAASSFEQFRRKLANSTIGTIGKAMTNCCTHSAVNVLAKDYIYNIRQKSQLQLGNLRLKGRT
jgi:hypothetical protein